MDLLTSIILSIAGFLGAWQVKQLSDTVKEAVSAIKELNDSVSKLVERTETHGNEIEKLRDKQDEIALKVAHLEAKNGQNY